MAPHPLATAQAAPAPEVADQVLWLPTALIEVGSRLRPVDPVHAEALAALMARDGQDIPIEVCRLPGRKTWLLVTGAHRLAAVALNGWDRIKAIEVSADALERRRREVSENLFHSGLAPLDRAAFVAELYRIEKARAGLDEAADPRTAGANARWSKVIKDQSVDATDTMSVAFGFSDRVAEQLGLTARTIRRDLELYYGVPAHLVVRLRGHPIASNAAQLRALAKLSDADQRAAVDLILAGHAKGASDAVSILRQKPAPSPDAKAWSAFFGGWSRMSAAKRREALRELAEQGLPKGVSIDFGDAHG